MSSIDLYEKYANEYITPADPKILRVGRAYYLALEGRGAPQAPGFVERIDALYDVAFALRAAFKLDGREYAMSKLEALWWVELPDTDFMRTPRSRWHWQLMIRVPDFVASSDVARVIASLVQKGKPAFIKRVRRITMTEGRCVQALHIGSYDDEQATLGRMHALAEVHGMRFRGAHHEIYLSDPRKVPAEKLRTILRMPIGR